MMIDPAFSQRIKLKFNNVDADKVDLIKASLSALEALDKFECKPEQGIIAFRYDASQVHLEDCFRVLEALDIKLHNTWWWRWRAKLALQLDANIRANARHVPHCCGKPPSGPRR
ncbi:hypothetical protein [Marinomonas ostreistagni]|uniref:hypothetical protein n=1 Tax=Marinomonas ostreistagni TaxID=359209 RepID=UPI00194EA013|nr:hypothetical protein [Marinomonas ostreistagni]MBM6550205.1 hypothetical protein [Marinomonas ostreistagni]